MSTALILKAKQLMQAGSMPREAYECYKAQVRNSYRRGIPFL